jgi:large subunit ribosomal protein L25
VPERLSPDASTRQADRALHEVSIVMETTLEATPRTSSGKGDARKNRALGRVPAVVYGLGREPEAVAIDPHALVELFKQTNNRNTIVRLKVGGGAEVPCLVREVQRHPVSRKILHVDFYAVPETPIEIVVPLRAVGRPKGALLGGRVRLIRRELRVMCRPDQIPEALEVDVSPLDVDEYLKASAIPLPKGVTLLYETDFNVINVYGKSKIKDDLPETVKPVVEGEAAAEGEADASEKADE